ncbi:unnamed protein product [Ilex paraguariensis]|uniref:GDSL esterase/lipase n=1 Tax=Ilex paraguariensis TaxID=185542 RepID=A0ABC8S1B6_9AQUA
MALIFFSLLTIALEFLYLRGVTPFNFSYPAVFNFGDSNSDTGGLAAGIAFPVGPPNGQTYFLKPSGRFCDGRLIIDFLMDTMGVSPLNSYLDSVGAPSFERGCNFATGGSTILPANANSISPFSFRIQVAQFVRFKARVLELLAKDKKLRKFLPSEDSFRQGLYMFDIGQNDLDAALYSKSEDQVTALIPTILAELEIGIKTLYNEGARNFWIHNTGPLGCLPRIIAIFGKDPSTLDEVGCVKVHNHAAMLFNTQLHSLSMKFQEQLPESNVTYTDIFSIKFNLISNFSQLGFKQPLSACCGYGGPPLNFDTRIACGETKNLNGTLVTAKPCNNTDEYVNWDGNHYTEAANLFISSQILSGKYSGPASIDEYPIFSWLQVE